MTPRESRALREWLTEHAPNALPHLDELEALLRRRALVAEFDAALVGYAARYGIDLDDLDDARRDLHDLAARLAGGAP